VEAKGVVIDMRSITTGISLRDKHTKEHLMVDKYPQARLIRAIGKDGKGKAQIEVKGIKTVVSGTYAINGDELVAHFPMTLSSVDIKNVKYMGVGVKDEVMVNITLPLKAGKN
jgi:hypothetical protein